MKVYNYDFTTYEYTGSQEADQDPEESLKKGEFVPLLPAYSTLKKPPVCLEDEVQIFDETNDKWIVTKKEEE